MRKVTFKEKIAELEEMSVTAPYAVKLGEYPIVLTACHTMLQKRRNGTLKLAEPYTKAIASYVSEQTLCSSFIKLKDTGIDSNTSMCDGFKLHLLEFVKDNNIKLVLDLHGASEDRDFDVEFGTLNHMSADFSTIKELEDAFKENHVTNICFNEPFKGGGITKWIYSNTEIDVIQLEINRKYRNLDKIDNLENICNALIQFIYQYSEYVAKE